MYIRIILLQIKYVWKYWPVIGKCMDPARHGNGEPLLYF